MADKLYYTMGEVTEMFDVNASLIRYWGTQFDVLRPHRNKKGNRMFTPDDVEKLKLIYHLVKEQGMTIAGARKHLRRHAVEADSHASNVELLERLQQIKALLIEVRDGMVSTDAEQSEDTIVAPVVSEVKADAPKVDVAKPVQAEPKAGKVNSPKREKAEGPKPATPKHERPELPFYEQTLF